jgi:proteasome assembly chaperone (PAC2) family protein
MKFVNVEDPKLTKPMVIAAMQDMGDVGSIVINFINVSLNTRCFRYVYPAFPNYVIDNAGYIDFRPETWEYRFGRDTIEFGGGISQPQTNEELYELCQDVIDVSKKYSAQLVYTVGAFHTSRPINKQPKTFVTTTSEDLMHQVKRIGVETTPGPSIITGFNGLILGFAKLNNLRGIGLYAEIDDPDIPQYRAAKSILQLLERLTYLKFGELHKLDVMAEAVDKELDKIRATDDSTSQER